MEQVVRAVADLILVRLAHIISPWTAIVSSKSIHERSFDEGSTLPLSKSPKSRYNIYLKVLKIAVKDPVCYRGRVELR
jgi:hypothetical protein